MPKHYIIDADRKVKEVDNLLDWARWMESNSLTRIIQQDALGDYFLSTVFLGIDYSFGGDVPVLFETMLFCKGKDCGRHFERYETIEQALEGHERHFTELNEEQKNEGK